MKNSVIIFLLLIIFSQSVFADINVFSEKGKFGLKNKDEVIVEAKYKKLVRLGETSWIFQSGSKFGIINNEGQIIVPAIYNQAERLLGKYVKFRKGGKYCLLNEKGADILAKKERGISYYSSIDLLYGGLIVTSINHKYGLNSFSGAIKIDNIFDDIYMRDKDTLVLIYGEKTIEFKRVSNDLSDVPFNFIFSDLEHSNIKLSDFANSPFATTGYYSVTFTDYVLKLISSISPAYEQTIDELMFSQGADSVSVIIKCSWIPKFPFVYAKNYYNNITDPINGPLYKAKKNLRKQMKD